MIEATYSGQIAMRPLGPYFAFVAWPLVAVRRCPYVMDVSGPVRGGGGEVLSAAVRPACIALLPFRVSLRQGGAPRTETVASAYRSNRREVLR